MKNIYESFSFLKLRSKTNFLTVVVFLMASFGLFGQNTITLGDGGTTNSTYFPLYYLYNYSYTQTIYTVDEIEDEGVSGPQLITSIKYKPTVSTSTSNWKDWVVYIGNTTKEGFVNSGDWIDITELDEVFDGEIQANVTANEWLEIELAVPFIWDGTSNIVVAVDQNTSNWGNTPSWAGYTLSPTSGSKGVYFYSDGTNPDPSNPPAQGASSSGTTNNVAQIQFEMIPAEDCAGTPSAGVVEGPSTFGVCLDEPFQIKMDGVTTGLGVEYLWEGRAAGSSDPWQTVGTSSTLNYPAGAFNMDLEFQLTVTCTISGESDVSDIITVTLNSANECYCDVSTTYSGDYISGIITEGALSDVLYEATSNPTGSYSDQTAQLFAAFETQVIDFGIAYVGGTFTFNMWIDWNQNGVFEASEVMANSYGSSPQISSFTVPVGTQPGNYRVRVRAQWSTGDLPPCGNANYGTTVDFNLEIVEPPTCYPVADLVISNLGADEVSVSWDAGLSGETSWEIEWGVAGYAPGTGAELGSGTSVVTNYDISGLVEQTAYDIYVRADCGEDDGLSYWSKVSVTTACDIIPALGFCEDVEGEIEDLNCWRVGDYDGDGSTWAVYSGGAGNSGDKAFGVDTYYSTPDDYLFLPKIHLTGNEVMSFYYKEYWSGTSDVLEVLLSTTGRNPADFQDTILAPFTVSNTEYKDTVIDLSAYSGDVFIAFHVPAESGVNGELLLIDDICIDLCIPTPGVDGSIEVCRLDGAIDLNDVITSEYTHGDWILDGNQGVISGSTLNTTALPAETFEISYIVETACTADTTVATVTVYGASTAGDGGTIVVCKNSAIDLYSGLSGNADMGGDWFDYNGNPLPNSQPVSANIPGNYNYMYVVSNGFCPADTAVIEVTVDPSCDGGLSIGLEEINELSVYPNPANEYLNISNPSNASDLKIEMLDMNGRLVLNDNNILKNVSEATLDIEKLERGVYTLRIYNSEGHKIFKIVKQ